MRIFGAGGGFVFNPIHNVQAGVPVENLLALYEAVSEFRTYPRRGRVSDGHASTSCVRRSPTAMPATPSR